MKKILVKFKEFWQNNLKLVLFYIFLVLIIVFVVVLPTSGDNLVKLPLQLALASPLVAFLVILRNIKTFVLLAEFVATIPIFGGGGFFLAYKNFIKPNIAHVFNNELMIVLVVLFLVFIGLLLMFQERLGTFWRRIALLPIIFCEIAFGLYMGHLMFDPPAPPPTYDLGGCFVERTLVWTPNGMSPIESTQEGNIVYAYDTQSATIVEATVENVIRKTRTELITIDDDLQVTPEHPMAVISDGNIFWKEAGELSVGECLVSQTGSCVNIHSITHRNLSSPASVINLSVSLPNNFFVIMGDKPILVHNKIPVAM